MLQGFLFCFISLLLTFPGVLVAYSLFKRRSLTEVFFLGSLLGIIAVIYIGRLFPLKLLPLALGLEYLFSIYIFIRLNRRDACITNAKTGEKRGEQPPSQAPRAKEDVLLWIISILSFRWFWVIGGAGIVPLGNDPMFHLLLVGKILVTGHTPTDWTPFESIPVNMATGGHLLVSMVSWLGGMAPHLVFKMLFAPLAFLTTGMLYLVGKELLDDRFGAALGTLLWLVMANWGAFYYVKCGGLPNMIGMLALLGAIWAVTAESGPRRWALIGLFMAGTILFHHHGAMTGIGILLTIIAMDRVSLGRLDERGREILAGLAMAMALVPFTVIRIVWRALSGEILRTFVLAFPEEFFPIQKVAICLGLGVALIGIFACAFFLAEFRSRKDIIIPAWVATILALYAIFGYLYRALAFGISGGFYGAFTPSDYVSELCYPVCILGGWFVASAKPYPKARAILMAGVSLFLIQYYARINSLDLSVAGLTNVLALSYIFYPFALALFSISMIVSRQRDRRWFAAFILILLLFISSGFLKANKISAQIGQIISKQDLEDMNRIRVSLPRDTLIINDAILPKDKNMYGWLPYWTWRECASTPLSPSEAQLDPSVLYKRTWLQPSIHEIILWANLEARPAAFIIMGADFLNYPRVYEIYSSKARKVYLYDPARP